MCECRLSYWPDEGYMVAIVGIRSFRVQSDDWAVSEGLSLLVTNRLYSNGLSHPTPSEPRAGRVGRRAAGKSNSGKQAVQAVRDPDHGHAICEDYEDGGPSEPLTSSYNANRRSCGLGITISPFDERIIDWAIDGLTARRKAPRKLPATLIAPAASCTVHLQGSSRIVSSSSSARLVAVTVQSFPVAAAMID
jgi:hypothetical protein